MIYTPDEIAEILYSRYIEARDEDKDDLGYIHICLDVDPQIEGEEFVAVNLKQVADSEQILIWSSWNHGTSFKKGADYYFLQNSFCRALVKTYLASSEQHLKEWIIKAVKRVYGYQHSNIIYIRNGIKQWVEDSKDELFELQFLVN